MSNLKSSSQYEYKAIIIDTSIYEKNGLKFDRGLLKSLSQFKKSPIKLLMPDVILNEVKSHLEKKVSEIIQSNDKLINDFKGYSLVNQEVLKTLDDFKKNLNAKNIVKKKLDEFIESTGAIFIECGLLVDVTKILEKYFSSSPPFSKEGKKKSEFPDAIVLYAIEKWAEENNAKVLAISSDNDWDSYCKITSFIDYTEDLGDVLSKLNTLNAPYVVLVQIEKLIEDDDSTLRGEIEDYLIAKLEDFSVEPEAESNFYWESEQLTTWFKSFTYNTNDCQVIQTDSDLLVVKANINIVVGAEGIFSLFVYDPIDKGNFNLGSCNPEVETDFDTDILLTFEGKINTEQSLDNLELTDIEILDRPSTVNFGSLELEYD
ncbi:PIN domain-containing protein [Entomomonas asaccharolytica]|uniref:DUF4935 domain-containing protein n=1 Tax=Entomomonas asaccharolytica TaxID=2785331 RepID=A0A974NE17_9GAMM|nr:PIN domain-containing protein [Entomomonas asaccharolytica]QQP85035.1 DUF4935 domain-containing protein [Entomomonas asaccharolytica]